MKISECEERNTQCLCSFVCERYTGSVKPLHENEKAVRTAFVRSFMRPVKPLHEIAKAKCALVVLSFMVQSSLHE